MSFTQNRLDFANDITYDEISNAMAYGKGVPSFVVKGLDLTGTTLTAGIFTNTGTFGQLGATGETYTIPANYTGYIVIKSTLNGVNSVSTIELSATRNDSDPTIVSNIKYFTIYKLNAGAIEEDYRHSSYVKNISFENVGGSNFVQNINGTKSNPFDASVFAGNRTLLNDKDINYDDTNFIGLPLLNDLNDIHAKSQTLVGDDKPFETSFLINDSVVGYSPNLALKLKDFVLAEHGYTIPDVYYQFKMIAYTADGVTSSSANNANKIEIWSNEFYFEFPFDYNFPNVKVLDRKGYIKGVGTQLYASGGNNEANITLSESLLLYDKVAIRWYADTEHTSILDLYSQADDNVTMHRLQDVKGTSYYDGTTWFAYTDILSIQIINGTSLGIVGAGKYAVRVLNNANGTSDILLSSGYGILEIIGLNKRAVPRTAIGLLAPQIEQPNIVPEIDNGVRGDK